jgi:hypothetical protein
MKRYKDSWDTNCMWEIGYCLEKLGKEYQTKEYMEKLINRYKGTKIEEWAGEFLSQYEKKQQKGKGR